eukprot:m.120961 g.120961  ORF g.120961 m.120961 type:complete len:1063 (+) comp16191_c0_seq1:70-3258(+)
MSSLTVFGVRSTETDKTISQFLEMLYGSQELSDKEKKKMAKMEKFLAKQQKVAVAEAAPKKEKEAAKEKEKKDDKKKPAVEYTYKAPAAGQKKDSTGPMAPSYNPKEVEDAWYAWWMQQGYFTPEYNENQAKLKCTAKDTSFTIVIPPPNVTGSLHLGHALTNSIEDALVRWHRMQGKRVLWNPGCDHAGIATQSVVEKRLAREKKTRFDLGREKFVEEVYKWKDQYGARIYEQLKGLGASLDWSREAFTMNPRCCKAVAETFIRLHEEGLIFRADRLVNWSCALNSAISDIEVEKKELSTKTLLHVPGYEEKVPFGVLTKFAYKLENSDDEIVVATTRPETMLGDVAIAVHPEDTRYTKFHGKFFVHPFVNRKLPLITDSYVDRNFGTGAVKITPGHDQNDFEMGERHKLPCLNVLTKTGLFTDDCGEFSGKKRFEVRKTLVARLQEKGLLRGEVDNPMVVPICSRSGDIVEPLRVPQWFLNCTDMAKDACDAVRNGELKIIPQSHEKIWFSWLDNIRDWCISRQLWWGHRIPAYFISSTDGSIPLGSDTDSKYWVSAHDEQTARQKAAKRFGVDPAKIKLRQDEDVLDTWFSSGIFPISIFGWPDETPDMKRFYPGDLLETGHDILFFWVARMVMMCKKLTGKLPFKEVFLHAIVRDAQGRKMSKALGNVIDPMDVRNGITLDELQKRLDQGNLDPREVARAKEGQALDYPSGIPECGVDALRFALCAFTSYSHTINLDVKRIYGYRTFCNKIFNAVKLVLMQLGDNYVPSDAEAVIGGESDADLWILSRLALASDATNKALAVYDFSAATTAVYNFWLYDFCDCYLELTKPVCSGSDAKAIAAARNTLLLAADAGLRLLSPFMPFLTEELWQRLPRRKSLSYPSVCVSPYPQSVAMLNTKLNDDFTFVQDVIHKLRSMKADYLEPKARPDVFLRVASAERQTALQKFREAIQILSKVGPVTVLQGGAAVPAGCVMLTASDAEVFMLVKGLVDKEKEIAKLEDKKVKLEASAAKLEATASMANYTEVVKAEVREANSQKLEELKSQIASIIVAISQYNAM